MSAPDECVGKLEIRGTQVWLCYATADLGLKWRPIIELEPLIACVRAPEEPKQQRYSVQASVGGWAVSDDTVRKCRIAWFDGEIPNAKFNALRTCRELNEQDGRER